MNDAHERKKTYVAACVLTTRSVAVKNRLLILVQLTRPCIKNSKF